MIGQQSKVLCCDWLMVGQVGWSACLVRLGVCSCDVTDSDSTNTEPHATAVNY